MFPLMRTWLSAVVVLALVGFAQMCAFNPPPAPVAAPAAEHHAAAEIGPQPEDHEETACSPGECGGEGEACPGGSSICCSTWGPPTRAGIIEPPIFTRDWVSDLRMVAADAPIELHHATRPVEIVRPPGPTEATLLLISAVSRRGPPSFS